MKKYLLILIFTIAPIVSIYAQAQRSNTEDVAQSNEIDITGVWESTTFFDDSPEPSIDTFIVLKFKSTYGIVCTSYEHFAINEIHRKSNKLEFTILNSLQHDDIYILSYKGKIENIDKMTFVFTNNKGGEVTDITWRRLKDY